jgi:alpha-galactosidase
MTQDLDGYLTVVRAIHVQLDQHEQVHLFPNQTNGSHLDRTSEHAMRRMCRSALATGYIEMVFLMPTCKGEIGTLRTLFLIDSDDPHKKNKANIFLYHPERADLAQYLGEYGRRLMCREASEK